MAVRLRLDIGSFADDRGRYIVQCREGENLLTAIKRGIALHPDPQIRAFAHKNLRVHIGSSLAAKDVCVVRDDEDGWLVVTSDHDGDDAASGEEGDDATSGEEGDDATSGEDGDDAASN